MKEDEMQVMERLGITSEQAPVYRYKEHKYARLKDAIAFAKIDIERHGEASARGAGKPEK